MTILAAGQTTSLWRLPEANQLQLGLRSLPKMRLAPMKRRLWGARRPTCQPASLIVSLLPRARLLPCLTLPRTSRLLREPLDLQPLLVYLMLQLPPPLLLVQH